MKESVLRSLRILALFMACFAVSPLLRTQVAPTDHTLAERLDRIRSFLEEGNPQQRAPVGEES